MSEFSVMSGPHISDLAEVAHILLPGRGRNETGHGLTAQAIDRVHTAADLYLSPQFGVYGKGLIVCSGYKTPSDTNGTVWPSTLDKPLPIYGYPLVPENKQFIGIPEADMAAAALLTLNISKFRIRIERHSIDTATNFANAEGNGHFKDDRPVAIIAQEKHLERMMKIIAPRTLRRDYIGVIVPEEVVSSDSFLANLFSKAVLAGMYPDSPAAMQRIENRATNFWNAILSIKKPVRYPR